MSTTTDTLVGLQESIIADTNAMFRVSSDLFNAVYTENAGSALTVNFATKSVPAKAAKQSTENGTINPTAVNIGQVPAKLETTAALAEVSKISIAAPNASMRIAEDLSGQIARAIDTDIASAGFTNEIGDGVAAASLDNFFDGIAELSSTGFVGQKVAVYHPKSFKAIGKDLLGLTSPNQKSADYLQNGYVATVGGVEIYVSPWVPVVGGVAQNMMYFKWSIGLGYRDPIIDVTPQFVASKAAYDILGDSYYKVMKLVDGAGVTLLGAIS